MVWRQFDYSLELDVLLKTSADDVGVLQNGRSVDVIDIRWYGFDVKTDAMQDPIAYLLEIGYQGVGFTLH